MKEITYVRNKEKKTTILTIMNSKSVGRIIFSPQSSQEESFSEYHINEDIEYLELKNLTFKKDAKFYTPPKCILVLSNCTFKGGKIDIIGGIVGLINPTLNEGVYTNRIFLSDVNTFNVITNNDDKSYVALLGKAKHINIIGNINISRILLSSIESIKINGEKINPDPEGKIEINESDTNHRKILSK